MKKVLSTILAVAVVASMSTVAFAETITAISGTSQKDVLAKITDASTSATVYSVDVTWGEMQFTYEKSGTMVWDADTHTYINNTTADWSAAGNEVTVTNHSNAAVNAALTFAKSASVTDDISGSFDVTSMALPSAVGKAVNDATLTGKSLLTLSGEASTIGADFVTVGTVTVSLT